MCVVLAPMNLNANVIMNVYNFNIQHNYTHTIWLNRRAFVKEWHRVMAVYNTIVGVLDSKFSNSFSLQLSVEEFECVEILRNNTRNGWMIKRKKKIYFFGFSLHSTERVR